MFRNFDESLKLLEKKFFQHFEQIKKIITLIIDSTLNLVLYCKEKLSYLKSRLSTFKLPMSSASGNDIVEAIVCKWLDGNNFFAKG